MILSHILVVFVFLCMSKSLELQTGHSIKRIKDEIWDILDINIIEGNTQRIFTKRTKYPDSDVFSKLLHIFNL